ncbi:MAG: hypothetical protein AB7G76_16955 [Steroidobacteraceae bacterium]
MNDGAAWYRQPVLWLGAVLFAAMFAASVAMIVLGSRHDDEALPTSGSTVLRMPADRAAPPTPPREAPP